MNINKAVNLTGLAAANIRFYETQGLILPSRRDNGYREYSDADIDVLLRIKLLREIGIPIEDIRRLQTAELRLTDALEVRISENTSQSVSLSKSSRLCERLRDDGAEYSTLDAGKYLSSEEPAALSYRSSDVSEDNTYPWHRLFARLIDISIYSLIGALLFFTLPHIQLAGHELLMSYIAFALMFVFEPLSLHIFGTTAGKLLMGIRISDNNGGKPGYIAALRRTAVLFFEGMGLGVPVIKEIMYIISCRRCRREELPWDRGFEYVHRDPQDARVFCAIAAVIVFALLQNAAETGSTLPPNRGELTVAEFAENVNSVCAADGQYDFGLDENGVWLSEMPCEISFVTDANGNVRTVRLDAGKDEGLYAGELSHISEIYAELCRAAILSRESFRCLSLDRLHSERVIQSGYKDWQAELKGVFMDWDIDEDSEDFAMLASGVHAKITIPEP